MSAYLPPHTLEQVNAVIARAHAAGRDVLFEHEVYAILKELEMDVPVHVLVTHAAQITARLLSGFGSDKVVMKVVADQVTHKQNMGGVKIVYKDLDFVTFTYEQMMARFAEDGIKVAGVLFVECIDYSPELGNEILLGFRESETFGPVISFSKGGSDAEHFARHFSSPNLILAPIDRTWAQALLESTHIHQKYLQQGHGEYIDMIVDAGVNFSHLSQAFSSFFDAAGGFVINEFEVNPFVFSTDGRFVAIDGFARFSPRPRQPAEPAVGDKATIAPFFEPDGIAVVGVSTSDDTKSGNIILSNLVKLARDDVYAVNPKGGELTAGGRKLPVYASLEKIQGSVDLAIITVPAAATLPVVKQCAAKKVRAAILIPGGFSEIDRNRDIEADILAVARQAGMRVIGPNCLGLIYSGDDKVRGINTFFVPEDKFSVSLEKDQNVAILSQSGALGIIEIENLKNAISPKVIVSYGNQLDVDVCDLVDYFQNDPKVDVIGCYIEGFKPRAGRKFFNIANAGNKPVVAYKAGRTEAGRKATESHTASIAGEYAVAKAAMKQAGVVVADTMIDHGDLIKTFALLNDFKVGGNRVVVIANAGYEKTNAADNLADLQLAVFDAATNDALTAILPPVVVPDPLLDLTPMADDETFERCIETVLESDAVDALLVSIVPQSALIHTTDDEIEQNPDNIAARIIRLVHRYRKPTAVSVNVISRADAVYNRLGKTLDAGGVPTFLTANRAMFCLNAFVRYRMMQDQAHKSDWLR